MIQSMKNASIAASAKIAPSAIICDNVYIGENVTIGENVFLDIGCIIRDNVTIGKGSKIGARCILGEHLQDFYEDITNKNHPLIIGEDALIRSETIIYGDCVIGNGFQTGHRVTIREGTHIGNHTRVGTLSDIQGACEIGDYVNLHSNVHIARASKLCDYVWIFPYVVLTNDPQPPSEMLSGVEVKEFAVIATGTVVLPGVRIGKDAMVGAGSVVTRDVPDEMTAFGNPAKTHGNVKNILRKDGASAYPWRNHFERGMPWAGIGYETWIKQQSKIAESGTSIRTLEGE